ncbi:hypothetical protein JCM8097_000296 [Rhodosporidiobolus ruineniae]
MPTQCPVPRTHPPDSPIWISSRPEGSSALFSTNCCPLGLWPYTFRQYNDLIWEPWIKSAYAMQRPFVLGREDDFRHHLDRVHIAETELVEQRAESCAAAIAPSAWTSSRDPFCRYMRWFRLSREEQEHLLLEVLDKISPREQGFYDFRQDAPEVLLADLLADGGQGLVRLAWTCIRSASKPDRPLPPCPAFDRLYGLHSFHSGVPLSAGKQAFVRTHTANRRFFLYDFCRF